ncbi:spermidine/putrescine ABC transporter permease PotB [Gallaecimonas pentaromativorans]|uniref:Spermidine/putrescine transport system permease protein n=1 Tax=Gallaecimonas pentaromativorans TaxID=584787 RepID=A0A3N1PI63_9GAMM|nr:spermidine/putrescine ABC transporter permease PotB [Gallaecimonas pentaromativorans]ROQ27508.1 spermidine/putrescine transport system permease protein [Gallaecimonas pentaromativorans]
MNKLKSFKFWAIGLISCWLVVFVLLPNLMILVSSFLSKGDNNLVQLPLSLHSYKQLMDPLYAEVLYLSVKLSFIATLICLLIGYPFAYAIASLNPKWRPVLLFLVIVPFWTNSLIRTYAIKILLGKKGLLNAVLIATGITDNGITWLYTNGAVIFGLVYILLPFMVLPLYSAIEKLDGRYLEAAADLGAGKIRTFIHVVLPLTMPGIVAGCLLVFLPAMGMFYVSDMLGGGKDMLVGNIIKRQILLVQDWPFGSAASVVITLFMGLLLALYWQAAKRINRQEALDG